MFLINVKTPITSLENVFLVISINLFKTYPINPFHLSFHWRSTIKCRAVDEENIFKNFKIFTPKITLPTVATYRFTAQEIPLFSHGSIACVRVERHNNNCIIPALQDLNFLPVILFDFLFLFPIKNFRRERKKVNSKISHFIKTSSNILKVSLAILYFTDFCDFNVIPIK